MYRSRALTVCLCVLVTAVTGKPHQCSVEEYAKALITQYNLSPAAVSAMEPWPFDYEAAGLRPGRSNDATKLAVLPPVVDSAAVAVPVPPPTVVVKQQTTPCRTTVPKLARGGNDTSSTATIEKLSAYYDHLKSQQEILARQQHQNQLFEQQQRRQQEYMLIQQQIQQQYLQQQQHALFMLDQLRKNPAFAGQLAAFAGVNGTAVPNDVAVKGLPTTVKGLPPTLKGSLPADVKEQTIANHAEVAEDCGANKRVGPRQTVSTKVDRSFAGQDDGPEDDQSSSEYDEQMAYDDTEKPAIVKKVYRTVTPGANVDDQSMTEVKRRAAISHLEVANGCGAKRLVTRQTDDVGTNPLSSSDVLSDDGGDPPTVRKLVNGYRSKRHAITRRIRFGVDHPSIVSDDNAKNVYRTVTEW